MTPPILEFRGPYRFLSNFHPAEVEMPDGILYPCTENAFQAYKTNNMAVRREMATMTPEQAKRGGRRCVLRDDWEKIKLAVMLHALREKFTGHTDLRAQLVGTKDAYLMEGNTWGDTYWGVCNGVGENWLGRLLMYVRTELQLDEVRMFI